MRQAIIALNLIGSFTIFALSVDLFETSVMFLLFGVMPGRTEPLSANQMLTIYTAATVLVLDLALRGSAASFLNLVLRATRPKQSPVS